MNIQVEMDTVTADWVKTKSDEQAVKEGCYFDMDKAMHAVEFFPRFLKHSKGEWAGEPFELLDWQKTDLIIPLFGWCNADGTRRFRIAYVEIPKKNGKSTLGSGLATYLEVGDGEQGAEVYIAATSREQAGIVFREAANMIKASKVLSDRMTINQTQKNITFGETNSFIRAIASDANTAEGLNISGLIFDEMHALKKRDFWDSLKYGGAARRQPLSIVITTAGYDRNSVCYETHEYARKVLDGFVVDTSFFPFIRAAELTDDWTLEETWFKANPSLGITIPLESFRKDCEEAKHSLTRQNVFKRYRLNIWTEAYERWLAAEKWNACGGPIDEKLLQNRPCWGGLDLGSTADLTCFCLVFPPYGDDPKYRAKWWFWAPEEGAKKRQERDRGKYIDWAGQGWMELTDGDETDQEYVTNRVYEISSDYRVMDIGVDRLFQGVGVSQGLTKRGLNMVEFGQGFFDMAAPTQEFERLINRGEFMHGDNPIVSWMASHVVVKIDEAENMKPDKKKSGDKIDGIVSAIMGLGRHMAEGGPKRTVYKERGIRSF